MGLQEFRTLYLEATLVKKCYRQLKPRGGLSLRGRQIQCWQLDFQELASGHGSSIPPLLGGVRASHRVGTGLVLRASVTFQEPRTPTHPTVVICRGRNCLGSATLRKDGWMPSYLLTPFRSILHPSLLSLPLLIL